MSYGFQSSSANLYLRWWQKVLGTTPWMMANDIFIIIDPTMPLGPWPYYDMIWIIWPDPLIRRLWAPRRYGTKALGWPWWRLWCTWLFVSLQSWRWQRLRPTEGNWKIRFEKIWEKWGGTNWWQIWLAKWDLTIKQWGIYLKFKLKNGGLTMMTRIWFMNDGYRFAEGKVMINHQILGHHMFGQKWNSMDRFYYLEK